MFLKKKIQRISYINLVIKSVYYFKCNLNLNRVNRVIVKNLIFSYNSLKKNKYIKIVKYIFRIIYIITRFFTNIIPNSKQNGTRLFLLFNGFFNEFNEWVKISIKSYI